MIHFVCFFYFVCSKVYLYIYIIFVKKKFNKCHVKYKLKDSGLNDIHQYLNGSLSFLTNKSFTTNWLLSFDWTRMAFGIQ